MQRRAAAVTVAFFIVVSAASYALIATAEKPDVHFENPEYSLQQGDTLTLDGETYTVSKIEAKIESSGGGGHGGGGGKHLVRSGELIWTNESARHTASWKNGSTVTHDGQKYKVMIEAAKNPSQFTLREQLNKSAILADDPDAEDEMVTHNGSTYVVVHRNGNQTLVPEDEYFPEPNEKQYAEGDTLSYENHSATVSSVSSKTVTLAWIAPRENSLQLEQETNVTLQGQTYLVFFPNNETVYLTQQFQSYQAQQNEIHEYSSQKNGLWGVSILSGLVAALMLGMAYLPSRY